MKNSVGSVRFRSKHRFLVAAPLRHPPNTVFLAVFGVLSVLASGAGRANSDARQADADDVRILARVSEAASCTRYGINRFVELRVSDDGQAPCEVAYLKPDEDNSTTSLWRAQNDIGYCALKFSEFIAKLENKLLWNCVHDGDSGTAVSAETTEPPDASVAAAIATPEAVAVTTPEDSAVTTLEVPAVTAPAVTAPEVSDVAETVRIGDEDPDIAEQASLAVPQAEYQRQEPPLASALVTTPRNNDGPGAAVSMEDVRARIPSGPYESITLDGTDASACPPGGSFFWNTRNPDEPVFEMGLDAEFTFSTARGRVGQGFALQSEPALILESDDPSEYRVASLSVVGVGTVEAQVLFAEGDESDGGVEGVEGRGALQIESICQYRLGGG